MTTVNLNPLEFDNYYKKYIEKVDKTIALKEGFTAGKKNIIDFFKAIPNHKLTYRYEQNKWSVKEIFQHLIDTERIFMYRCFRIARKDITKLAGFDQNVYIAPSEANNKSIEGLIAEFSANRDHSICLLNSLTATNLCFIGNANGSKMSARAAAFIIIGHDIWHTEIIKEKYL